jgi:hypothetical protein
MYAYVFQMVSFSSDYRARTVYACLLSLHMPHALPISFLMWSFEWYLVRSTDHKAPSYVVSSIPLLPRRS